VQIDIEFDSCWQNSFLSGDDGKPISKENKRKFIATTQSKEKKVKTIDEMTVLGVLCRLIGDQRKLHQIRTSDDYYFKDIEKKVSHSISKDKHEIYTSETVYLTNKDAGKIGQSIFLGTIPNDCPWFFSDSSVQLWSILYLSLDELLDFILDDKAHTSSRVGGRTFVQPRDLLHRIDTIKNMDKIETLSKQLHDIQSQRNKEQKKLDKCIADFEKRKRITEKTTNAFLKKKSDLDALISSLDEKYQKLESNDKILFDQKLSKVINDLDQKFPKIDKKTGAIVSYLQNEVTYAMNLYAAALYLQADCMMSMGIGLDYVVSNNYKIQGFSKRGFNGVRDFINPMTGNRKQAVGTPFPLTKATGKLKIIIDVDRDRAKYIKGLIENAGVSSFYLGKKGLAYVTNISTREVRK